MPIVLAGDMNAVPGSGPMKALAALWHDPTADAHNPTIPVNEPKREIDYVLLRPSDRFTVIEHRVIDERVASDHRPVLLVVDLKPKED